MEMKKVNAGKLRGIAYDKPRRILQVQLDDGSILQYSGVSEALWRRFGSASSQWSFYRDNIEEEFASSMVAGSGTGSASQPAGRNPLDDLFSQD